MSTRFLSTNISTVGTLRLWSDSGCDGAHSPQGNCIAGARATASPDHKRTRCESFQPFASLIITSALSSFAESKPRLAAVNLTLSGQPYRNCHSEGAVPHC